MLYLLRRVGWPNLTDTGILQVAVAMPAKKWECRLNLCYVVITA